MNRFTYWKNGVLIGKKSITKVPKGGTEKLVYYQILNGEFDESPYWKIALEEEAKFEGEIVMWKEGNKRASKEAFEDWKMNRRKVYNKKIQKLREEHQKYEVDRLFKLKKRMNHDFPSVLNSVDFDSFEGNLVELYFECKNQIAQR